MMEDYFTITTNREVADQIKRQCIFDERMGNRSYKLGDIRHEEQYSVVQIKAKDGQKIKPEDLFWLGHLSSTLTLKCDRCGCGNRHINGICDECVQELSKTNTATVVELDSLNEAIEILYSDSHSVHQTVRVDNLKSLQTKLKK